MRADSSDKSLLVLIDTYDASRNYVLKKEAVEDERQASILRPEGLRRIGCFRYAGKIQAENSRLRVLSWALSRARIDECICETRDSDKSSVAPISFIVISS